MESPVGKILIGVTGKKKRLFLLHYPCEKRPEVELKRYLGSQHSFEIMPSKNGTARARKQ